MGDLNNNHIDVLLEWPPRSQCTCLPSLCLH
jgi:hypothetical protein